MKFKKKFIQCIVFFCALFIVFSPFLISVSAAVVDDFDMYLTYSIGYTESSESYVELNVESANYDRGYYAHEPVSNIPMDRACLLRLNSAFKKSNGSVILNAGEKFNITLRGLFLSVEILDQLHYWDKTPDRFYFELIHPDGTSTIVSNLTWSYSAGDNSQTVTALGITTKEVVRIDFHQYIRQYYITDISEVTSAGISIGDFVNPTYISLTVQSEEAGLLEDIGDQIDGIGNQIDSAINGTPQQNQQAQDAIDGLGDSTDKLGDLGDQMASVKKPVIDSTQISAGSLVPETSLVVLSAPFQALWENEILLAMLTIVVTLVLVSWVFFGKKG